jgi:hypothetical protein
MSYGTQCPHSEREEPQVLRWIARIVAVAALGMVAAGIFGVPVAKSTTAVTTPAIPTAGFFGEWGQHSMAVTLAPDGSAYYKAWSRVANGTSWSATWSPMTSTTAMIVLTTQLESHGDTDSNFLHRYPGEAFTFTVQPDGYATITTPSGQPTSLCPRGADFHDTEGLCGA